jgi:Mg-chelatase subunit ChlD
VAELVTLLRSAWADWTTIRLAELQYAEGASARTAVIVLIGLSIALFVLRALVRATPGRGRVALPALAPWSSGRPFAWMRHGALVLGLAGLPFFILALADPRTSITREEVSYPGRRISLMIDASSSMLTALPANRFAEGAPNNAAFFTTVGAARYFIDMRSKGKYRDLMALIEFGDDAYVITPFTTDYDNILLSTSLIGDWQEFMTFPDQGTVIARAVEQSVAMFEAFEALDASGNLMVLFTDGADAEVLESGRSVQDVVEDARRAKIPIYFIKVGRSVPGRVQIGDEMWRAAVERTGGHFYPAADEESILKAIADIDRSSAGTIELKQYSTERPRFAPFALAAAGLWSLALALRLLAPVFQTFP